MGNELSSRLQCRGFQLYVLVSKHPFNSKKQLSWGLHIKLLVLFRFDFNKCVGERAHREG